MLLKSVMSAGRAAELVEVVLALRRAFRLLTSAMAPVDFLDELGVCLVTVLPFGVSLRTLLVVLSSMHVGLANRISSGTAERPPGYESGKGRAILSNWFQVIHTSKAAFALCVCGFFCMVAPPLRAQHDMSQMAGMNMRSVVAPLGIPFSRFGSGTSWLPDSSPMRAAHRTVGDWMLMLHGAAFGQFDHQGTRRGDTQPGLTDWEMLTAARDYGGGLFRATLMTSFEALVLGRRGYPELLQTGGTYRGVRLVDRQHPHDLFMETALAYDHSLTSHVAAGLYVAAVGEPALGPVAFMHRPSAEADPFAPLGHHWQDATHESFGVVTGGLYTHSVKVEGSAFNGREPDEYRFNFDYQHAKLDSYAGRLTVLPNGRVSVSAWGGYLSDHDPLEPGLGMQRYGASVITTTPGIAGGSWSSSLIWGLNIHHHSDRDHVHDPTVSTKLYHVSSSVLLESALDLGARTTVYGRVEQVQKNGDDLGFIGGDLIELFTVRSLSAAVTRDIRSFGDACISLGVRASLDLVPTTLRSVYGTTTPAGVAVFVRLRTAKDKGRNGRRAKLTKTGTDEGRN